MSLDVHILSNDRSLNIRQRLKGIFYFQKKNLIVPLGLPVSSTTTVALPKNCVFELEERENEAGKYNIEPVWQFV
jgi:hypothetical protein